MKATKWLVASFAINAILAGVLISFVVRDRGDQPGNKRSESTATLESSRPGSAATVSAPAKQAIPQSSVQAMRAAGISEHLIADVLAADFDRRWQQRAAEMQKSYDRGDIDEEAMARFHLQYATDQERELRAALGDDGFRRWDQEKTLREFDNTGITLSAGEADAFYNLHKSIDQQRRDLEMLRLKGEVDDADYEKRSEAEQADYEKQLKTILGDERYAARQNSNGGVEGDLRRSLQLMDATSEQTDAMMHAQDEWSKNRASVEEQLRDGEISSAGYEEKTRAIDQAREQEYQRTLGTNGYAQFQKTQDYRYRTMKRYAKNWGLTDEDIDSLYNTIQYHERSVRDYTERAQQVEAQGQAVDWEAVQKILREYSRQAEEALKAQLGAERFQKLKRNNVLASE